MRQNVTVRGCSSEKNVGKSEVSDPSFEGFAETGDTLQEILVVFIYLLNMGFVFLGGLGLLIVKFESIKFQLYIDFL